MNGNMDGIRKMVSGMTAAKGFKATSTTAGIKYRGRKDMALIYNEAPCKSAGIFTSNIMEAAPVKWDKNQVTGSVPARTVVVSAGIADTRTSKEDMGYCSQTAGTTVTVLGVPAESMLVASAGVIGKQLSTGKVKTGIRAVVPLLDGETDSGTEASKAVMTTDTKNKEVAVQFELDGVTVTMGGVCRSSGMIHPNMCTMLNFVTADAAISKEVLQETLSKDIKGTCNVISVDDDASTNDVVLLLANGLAGSEEIREENSDYRVFCKALNYVNETLAKKMAGGGEGCTTLFKVTIVGTETKDQAKVLAKSIITSSLTKAAIFGHGASWGRIFHTMGCSGASFNPGKVDLFFESAAGKVQIIKDDVTVDYSEERVAKTLSQPQVTAVVDIEMGDAQVTAWGCDLTLDCMKVNTDYRS